MGMDLAELLACAHHGGYLEATGRGIGLACCWALAATASTSGSKQPLRTQHNSLVGCVEIRIHNAGKSSISISIPVAAVDHRRHPTLH